MLPQRCHFRRQQTGKVALDGDYGGTAEREGERGEVRRVEDLDVGVGRAGGAEEPVFEAEGEGCGGLVPLLETVGEVFADWGGGVGD